MQTFLFLFNTENGELSAIMEVLYYDWLKTGAVAAVASRHLAPKGKSTAAIFGTGRHARTQLHALYTVPPITRVQAFSRTPERRKAFCQRMADELDIEVVSSSSPKRPCRAWTSSRR